MVGMNRIGLPEKMRTYADSFVGATGGSNLLLTVGAAFVNGTGIVDVRAHSAAEILLRYHKGDETKAHLRVMCAKGDTAPTDASEWFVLGELGAATAGVRALSKGEVTLTPASFAADDYVAFEVETRWADWIRVDAYAEGGVAPGTLWAGVCGAWGM